MWTRIGRATTGALLLGLATWVPALAAAPATLVRNAPLEISFIDPFICPGAEIETTFDGKVSRTLFFDADGSERELVIDVIYVGWFTNLATGDTVRTPGARHIVLDFEAGLVTESGVYRLVTADGAGNVLHDSGRLVTPLEGDFEVLWEAGPHEDVLGDYGAICDALGV